MGYETMVWIRAQVPTAERRWRGNNYSGYSNSVLEEQWGKALSTPDPKEREPFLVEALTSMTADAVINPIHSRPRAMAFRHGLVGPKQSWVGEAALAWNSWEWHWKGAD
jgi:hypothetical protein